MPDQHHDRRAHRRSNAADVNEGELSGVRRASHSALGFLSHASSHEPGLPWLGADLYAAFMKAAPGSHGMLSLSRASDAMPGRCAGVRAVEITMLDVLMLALGAASFALLALYLVACERG